MPMAAMAAEARWPEWPRTDFGNTTIDLAEIQSGGPPKDGIPAIDTPRFVSVLAAAQWLHPREPVIALTLDEQARAYPLQILIWHEIVNDTIAGVPVAVTFCPLCNASIVYDRRLQGRVLDFGTTGKLRKSDLVMYDRQTESWWQQFTGKAIVGTLAGNTLTQLPAPIVAFETFRETYPDGQVLSRETGHQRDYGHNPYRGYDRVGDQPFLLHESADPRLPAMERVLGISAGDDHRLYPLSALKEGAPVNDSIDGTPIVVLAEQGTLSVLDTARIRDARLVPTAAAYDRRIDGKVLTFERRKGAFVDRETGSTWNLFGHAVTGPLAGRRLRQVDAGVHFAFAWLAFRPQSVIFQPAKLRPADRNAQQE
ncbi:MAG: DUF3179 domain-containing protein, partial [Gammaproteobacteria bacterium]